MFMFENMVYADPVSSSPSFLSCPDVLCKKLVREAAGLEALFHSPLLSPSLPASLFPKHGVPTWCPPPCVPVGRETEVGSSPPVIQNLSPVTGHSIKTVTLRSPATSEGVPVPAF